MNKTTIKTIAAAFALALSSCGNEPPISESKAVEVIIKMHEADAIMFVTGYSDATLKGDSASYYNYIFKETGVTKAEFLETIEWYTQHPERYKILYEKVVKVVNVDDDRQRERDEKNRVKADNDLWNERSYWNVPKDGITNPVAYEIPTNEHGIYTISADFIYYEDDGTVDPRLCIIADYDDGTNDFIQTRGFKKDGKKHRFSAMIKTNNAKGLKQIRGWVLDQRDDTKSKHVDVSDITLLYTKE
ncbi:MAG: DUF4296 domain-containing protein [Bacteroidales bacterium]|nr:DUF4296 domain-containing protein [Bacteroidales bacterium]